MSEEVISEWPIMRLVLDLNYDYHEVKTKYTYYDVMKLNAILDCQQYELNKQDNKQNNNRK